MQLNNASNAVLCRALTQGLGALHTLDDMGLRVRGVSAEGRNVVIEIEPPAQPSFLQGVIRRRCTAGRLRDVEYVARVRGCEVRWSHSEVLEAKAVGA